MKYKNIFISGGSGFLGRQIVTQALEIGYNVFCPRSSEVDIITGMGIKEYFNKLKGKGIKIDCIIHSAAYYGGIGLNQDDPVGLLYNNTQMAQNIFKIAIDQKVGKIISVGSACAYPGQILDELFEKDIFNGRCHDSVEAYGFTKRLHLVYNKAIYKQYGIESNQILLTNLYGENDHYEDHKSHVIAALIKKIVNAKENNSEVIAWGTGKPVREFLYVKDAAFVIVKSIEFDHDLEPINVKGEEVSIYELSNIIADLVGLDKNLIHWDSTKPDGVMRKVLNGDKLKGLLPDFKKTEFRSGLKKAIQWYVKNK
ncbi:MAG: NAD-dependent epimerase/dehydratase family protein [Candidatus Delongbacteria bacterium]|nr:NAD-dependent epimerase/dehydratase family protein [Candidatus Delongbacteria bacterium]